MNQMTEIEMLKNDVQASHKKAVADRRSLAVRIASQPCDHLTMADYMVWKGIR
jgi:hypothetical protein